MLTDKAAIAELSAMTRTLAAGKEPPLPCPLCQTPIEIKRGLASRRFAGFHPRGLVFERCVWTGRFWSWCDERADARADVRDFIDHHA